MKKIAYIFLFLVQVLVVSSSDDESIGNLSLFEHPCCISPRDFKALTDSLGSNSSEQAQSAKPEKETRVLRSKTKVPKFTWKSKNKNVVSSTKRYQDNKAAFYYVQKYDISKLSLDEQEKIIIAANTYEKTLEYKRSYQESYRKSLKK